MKADQISGPGWLDSERYEIAATVPRGATKEQVRRMMRNLLGERLQLALHRETRIVPIYELVVGKGGSKLTAQANLAGAGMIQRVTNGHLRIRESSGTAGGGTYDFHLEFAQDMVGGPMDGAEDSAPGIFSAVRAQPGRWRC